MKNSARIQKGVFHAIPVTIKTPPLPPWTQMKNTIKSIRRLTNEAAERETIITWNDAEDTVNVFTATGRL